VVEDVEVGDQYAVVPVQEGVPELSMEDNEANVEAGIGEQPDGFTPFSTPYVEQPEVIWLI